ncbi:unnamed protein product [Adineta ricciae]|uniref:guanylate cyclase n=1 Tax=Adineta ricciae TaxID=249248 RepID=A0A814SGC5_ADIRI|nr:unnamed protein product [Adineta ricciae]CAF1146072.1 unnamed protein product [Adineta ricciae]
MLYGLVLDSARDGIIFQYGSNVWKRVIHELKLPSDTFDLFTHYNDQLLLNISECLVDILREGTRDTYLHFFGQDFFRYFAKLDYDKVFRVAGRTLRDFLFVIDQLHDSNRFTFPHMRHPLFHVTEEDHTGVTLEYKSIRRGFTHYAMGSLTGIAKRFFHEDGMRLYIRDDLSTNEYTHVVLWLQFDNRSHQPENLISSRSLPDVTCATFFKISPFSILMDSCFIIRYLGDNIKKVFPTDTILMGRPLNEVFRLIRPNIHVEWDKILSYGRHIVFLMDNRLPLRVGSTGKIRLKGQMKYIQNKNMLWFLCHPVLGSADDMISAGLHLTDLSLFDNTSELLVTNMRRSKEVEEAFERQKVCLSQLEQAKSELSKYHRQNQNILSTIMPKHISLMIQSGIPVCSLCESYPLVTIMFTYIMDLKMSTAYLKPIEILEVLNTIINIVDSITDRFDVLKVKTKMDASYMFVAGLHDRSNVILDSLEMSRNLFLLTSDDDANEKNPSGFNPTEIIAYLSLEILHASKHLINPMTRKPFGIKIGFHVGPAIGGVVGDPKQQYCLFGDAVTIAREMMNTGEIDRIHMSHAAYQQLVANRRFVIDHRGETHFKGRNGSETYWLTSVNHSFFTTSINRTKNLSRCPFSGQLL